ncbi:transcriptional regulator with XRE-family HTH domain [Hamadaea flava]|uniref:Helix-turn-helix domain-containing protein n=1 Tax=Hamadaea flava TaxID=1742688 RepID=A0ABV8LZF9_9ACTN|nr:helix-turn-helix transcriptional regulator [Hamadaea flava]MCP2326999.1 transcriptional regulator with XRE-family HTH domain [Hamadaea flava]
MARQNERAPADPADGPIAEFGYELRQLRQKGGYSYAELARRTYYSRAALHAADHGYQLPTVEVVKAYVGACDSKADVKAFVEHRDRIAAGLKAAASPPEAVQPATPWWHGQPLPDPTTCSTKQLYVEGLKMLRELSGLSYNRIYKITVERNYHPTLRQSSWHRATNGGDPNKLPPKPNVTSFLKAIDLPDEQQKAWLDQWVALYRGYAQLPTPRWAALSTAGHTIVGRTPPPPMETIRDWQMTDHGEWIEIRQEEAPGLSLLRPPRHILTAVTWLLILLILFGLVLAAA